MPIATKPKQTPLRSELDLVLVLLLLWAVDLGHSAEGLLAVLALLACERSQYLYPPGMCGMRLVAVRIVTYAAGGMASRSWRQHRHGRGGSVARTWRGPLVSRRRGRIQWSCHHRTGSGVRKR